MNRPFPRKCLPLFLLLQAALAACVTPAATPRASAEVELREKAVFLCRHGLLDAPLPSRLPSGARVEDYIRQEDLAFLRDNPRWFSRVRAAEATPAPGACEVVSVQLFADSSMVGIRTSAASEPDSPGQLDRVTFVWTPLGWRASYFLPEAYPATTDGVWDDSRASYFAEKRKVTRPERLSGPDMQYTRKAFDERVQGLMIARCLISREGEVKNCRVLKPLPHMTEHVLEVLHSSRYKPAAFDGEPIDLDYTFNLVFLLPRAL